MNRTIRTHNQHSPGLWSNSNEGMDEWMEGKEGREDCKLKLKHISNMLEMGKTKLWASRDAHLGDKPIKKFKKMLNGKVSDRYFSTGRESARTGRAIKKELPEAKFCFLNQKAGCS